MTPPPRLLVLTDDVLGDRMAGPAIRAVELARTLATDVEVTLASAVGGRVDIDGVTCADGGADLRPLVGAADTVLLQGAVMARNPWLRDTKVRLVVDLYDPFHLETLHLHHDDHLRSLDDLEGTLRTLGDQITRGDYFICATERQRAMWIGHLAALGRINPRTRAADPTLRALIDVVPFGLPTTPPAPVGAGITTRFPRVGPDDPVLLWGGGIYDWFDPTALVRAAIRASSLVEGLRLVFLAGPHPNPDVPEMATAAATRHLAAELDPDGTTVLFVDEWVPYDERQQLLLDATVGVTTHRDSIETTFSFRTRVLDYLWAGLPVITTGGDELSDRIAAAGAGRVVPPDDVEALVAAIVALTDDRAGWTTASAAAAELGRGLRWPEVAAPLRRYLRDGHRAPDLTDPLTRRFVDEHRPPLAGGAGHLARRVRRNLDAGGAAGTVSATLDHVRRRLSR